jgi:hypothetical protein
MSQDRAEQDLERGYALRVPTAAKFRLTDDKNHEVVDPHIITAVIKAIEGAWVRVQVSDKISVQFPNIEDLLWQTACRAKDIDYEIMISGLYVRLTKAVRSNYWAGLALPQEISKLYGRTISHPAGRINLTIGTGISDPTIVRLFAHELRHIGQFRRGRKQTGFLGTYPMPTEDIEPDCLDFEEEVASRFRVDCHASSGYEAFSPK